MATLYEADAGDLEVALAGDLMLTRRISMAREPRFLALRDLLSKADASRRIEALQEQTGRGT